MGKLSAAVWVGLMLCGSVVAGATDHPPQPPPKPGAEDRCAVCGMYVARYPAWTGAIVLEDTTVLYFDGPKDLFKYLTRRNRQHQPMEDVDGVWVTDYYTLQPIPARSALFVTGSDVMGPMGAELIPFSDREAAAGFVTDHGGTAILSFDDARAAALAQ